MNARGILVVVLAAAWMTCGAVDETGSLTIRISGESAAKQGYPLIKDNETIAFADGWQVRFSKVLVSLSELRLATFDGQEVQPSTETLVADLHQGDPVVIQIPDLVARRWDRFDFKIVAPTANGRPLNAVAADDIGRMAAGGFNYWIEGTATKAGETFTFAWGLQNPTRNANCTNGFDGTDGFVIKPNAVTEGEITIHMDHLFWDTLGAENAKLRFDAIAGASKDDLNIDFQELAMQSLVDPSDRDGNPILDAGGAPLSYNPGSVPLQAPNLAAFILAASASQAHVNGLGLCTVSQL